MAFRLHESHDPAGHKPGVGNVAGPPRRRRRPLAALPTLITLANLLCGFGAVFMASRNPETDLLFSWTPLTFAACFVFAGMVMDGLDGRVARMTRSTSSLGEQLDSMADMVTFGVAPAFMAVQLVGVQAPFVAVSERYDLLFDRLALVIACIYVACTALRLARFNVEVGQPDEASHMSFKGLPSPGAAATVASLILLHQHFLRRPPQQTWIIDASAAAMVCITLLVAFAMVSRLRYPHLVNRYLRGRVPFQRVAMIVVIALFLVVRLQESLALACTVYALWAPVVWLWRRIFGASARPAAGISPAPAAPQPGDQRHTGT